MRPRSWSSLGRSRWLSGLIVVSALFVWLVATRVGPPVHDDTARDLLQAVACSNGNIELCKRGPHTSFAGYQGALWPRFLVLGHELRISLQSMQLAILAFTAIGAGIAAAATRRLFDDDLAFLTTSVSFVGLSLFATQYPIYWNPSLLPLPLAIFTWALLEHSRSGRAWTALVASLALALAVDLHIVCLVFVPLLVVSVTASAQKPLSALTLAFVGFCSSLGVVSPLTWSINLSALGGSGTLMMALPITCVGLGMAVRPRWLASSATLRSFVLVALMTGWLAIPAISDRWEGRYTAPSIPAVSIALGWALVRLRTATNRALASAGIGLILWRLANVTEAHHDPEQFNLLDISRIASAAEDRGVGGDNGFFRLEGLSMPELASLVAFSRLGEAGRATFLAVSTQRAALPSPTPKEWELLNLGSDRVAILRGLGHPFLRREDVEACYIPLASGAEARCMRPQLPRSGTMLAFPPIPEFAARFGPEEFANLGPFRAEFSLPIDTHAPGSDHVIDLSDVDENWQFEAVEGVSFEGALPARRIVVKANSGEGRLKVARDFPAGSMGSHWPPIIIETLAEESELRRLYEQSRPRLDRHKLNN